jgi:hypothetical protein
MNEPHKIAASSRAVVGKHCTDEVYNGPLEWVCCIAMFVKVSIKSVVWNNPSRPVALLLSPAPASTAINLSTLRLTRLIKQGPAVYE